MTARTHDLAAISALGIVALSVQLPAMSLSTALVAVLANLVGGIAPDIDEPTAPLWHNLPIGGLFGRQVARMLGGHRFITHSLFGVGLFSGLLYLLMVFLSPLMPHTDRGIVTWAFVIGMVSHLFMDSLTREGVPWLLPIPIKFGLPPWRALRVTTGSWVEFGIVAPAIVLADAGWSWTHYHQIIDLLHQRIG
jgi:inner membrane protein